ncbi:MAG TPA: prepilin-type N-terminal cleavage/methylation domain-containing protein [Candidatus Hydrogenedentes bacterium]|nr:prepilin-type N-terminal cleavage/methylation domain-containing protein [Candidatus Hydrogenedentota bacterium]HNT86884.1 prepilin-type N-terminal cleavage/methylation domain-containing protein [Candidatus Hydrogenedentota bacterium]
MRKHGFTLIEVMVAMGVFSIVSLLGFIAIRSTYESQSLIAAQSEAQRELRDVMSTLTTDLELAYAPPKAQSVINPEGVEPISLAPDGRSVRFYRPIPDASIQGFTWTGPITFLFEHEDTDDNALLDPGEDANSDGMLTRRIVRQIGDVATPVGGANNLSAVEFELLENAASNDNRTTRLRIRLEATVRYGPGNGLIARQELESEIQFLN